MLKNLLKPEMKAWFDKSAGSELYAHHLYQHVANNLQRIGLFGAQEYFVAESNSELEHYRKLANFVNDMGSVISVPAVEKITDTISSLSSALDVAYEAEYELLFQYQKFYEDAFFKSKDYATAIFIEEYVKIQTQSVGEVADLISRLKLGGDIYAMDKYMKKLVG